MKAYDMVMENLTIILREGTVETTRFAPLTLDSPPLISIYYLPYENGKLKKIVFYSGHHSSFNWSSYEKCPTLGFYLMNLGI